MININKDEVKHTEEQVKSYVSANKKILKLVAVLFAVMVLTSHIKGCIAERKANAPKPRIVTLGESSTQDVPVYIKSFGTINALNSADVVAQITGEITEVHFSEGEEVKAGDLLFTIDKAPYKAQLDQAKAQLEAHTVDYNFKKDTLNRNMGLIKKDLVSKQEYEQYQTDMDAAAAQVELDKAKVEEAKINLDYCDITSPIDGVTGKRQVDKGNIVTANSGPTLVNIKTIDKVYIDFTIPDRDLPSVRSAMKEGDLKVSINPEGEDNTYEGELESIDNTVDNKTGTISLRAIIPNGSRALWPGQFVKVSLLLKTEKDVIVVPFEAAQIGKDGYYVFVMGKGDKAELKNIKVGEKYEDKIVVTKGLEEGQQVVIKGQLALRPGTKLIDYNRIPKSMRPVKDE